MDALMLASGSRKWCKCLFFATLISFFLVQHAQAAPVAKTSTETVHVLIADEEGKEAKRRNGKAVLSALSGAQHVNAGVDAVLLTPSASPYALAASSGRQTFRFSVPLRLSGSEKAPVTVYLRRKGSKENIALNDLGNDGDFIARDGIYGVNVQVDTVKQKPDTCLSYEAVVKQGRAIHVSPPMRLCVSSFPLTIAGSNTSDPVTFPEGTKAVADEVLISVTPVMSATAIRELASGIHASVAGTILPLNFYQLKLPSPVSANRLLEIVAQLKAHTGVLGASINAMGQGALAMNDAAFNLLPTDSNSQHGLKLLLSHVQATNANAWDAGANGSGVTVVVLDTGLQSTHPDLNSSWTCQNASSPTLIACSDTTVGPTAAGHGTEVTGVIAARTGNSVGVAGLAYGSNIHSIKMSSYTVAGMTEAFQAAAAYVGMNGTAKIVNASFNVMDGFSVMDTLCASIEAVVTGARAIVVNAAGNQGQNGYSYPARCLDSNAKLVSKSLFITVSSSASFVHPSCGSVGVDQRCAAAVPADANQLGSNFGSWVNIAAPGSVIRTTTIGSAYASPTGTSLSAPLVSGAATILASCGMPLGQIKAAMTASANVIVPYPAYAPYAAGTTPRLDIHRALSYRPPTGIGLTNSNIDENNAPGATVGLLSATDPDPCDVFSFALVAGAGSTDNGAFSITGNTLTINAPADYETKTSYSIRVQVTDFGGATYSQTFTINVNNLNDNPPVITSNGGGDTASISILENTTAVTIVTATDVDALGALTYSVAGGADAAKFAINSTTGELSFVTAPDYEVPTDAGLDNIYDVIVQASDGTFTDTQAIAVTVTNVNESPIIDDQTFDHIEYNATPPPGAPPFDPNVGIVTAIDPENDALTYTVVAGNEAVVAGGILQTGAFAFDPSGCTAIHPAPNPGCLVVANNAAVNFEFMPVFNLTVQVTDGVSSPATAIVTVNLTDDPFDHGDPHITAVGGLHYDFQSAGEFVALRTANGMEIQTRQTPVSTASPITDSYSGLTAGVSINTAVAARVGKYRVTFQPSIIGNSVTSGLELRVDGVLTNLPTNGLDLGSGGRVMSSPYSGIQIDFPDRTTLIATPWLWGAPNNVWYLNIDVLHTTAREGIMGTRANGSWLPRLSNGTLLGAMPIALHDRYVELYEKFADSWRVNDKSSLFDYAPETSTKTFTFKEWPRENPPYVIGERPIAKPVARKVALRLCRDVVGKNNNADCMFDVMVTGNAGIAKSHLISQKIRAGSTAIIVREDRGISRSKESLTFIATVSRNSSVALKELGIKGVPTGTVQFTVGRNRVGELLKLDSKGQARWQVSSLKVGKLQVGARYIPAKGSVFLPSSSIVGTGAVMEKK